MTQTPEDFTEDFDPDKPPPNNRRGARQLALQALYWNACLPGTSAEAVQELGQRFSLGDEICTFAADPIYYDRLQWLFCFLCLLQTGAGMRI